MPIFNPTTISGTPNQVLANGNTGTTEAGLVTLTLPQSIGTTSSPTFSGLSVSGLNNNGVLYASTGGSILSTTAPTNGQILIGSTGNAPVLSTLSAGPAVTISNNPGAVSIAVSNNPILPGNESLTLVSGTTAQRPISPTNGMIRYNTTLGYTEIYQAGVWYKVGVTTPGGVNIAAIYSNPVPIFNTNAQVPYDNTVPLITEGAEVWTTTITPISTASKLKFTIPFTIDISANNQASVISVFRGTTNIGSAVQYSTGGGRPTTMTLSILDSPNTTSPVTYSMRAGAQSATVFINSTTSGNNLGGALLSYYEIIEVL